jgi:hypothetical protein
MASSEGIPTTGHSQGGGHDSIGGLLTLNNLAYTMPSDLSVCVSRTCTNQFFQSKDYSPSQTAICILNTGSAYVHPMRSYLRLDFVNTSTAAVCFGSGSACNLISRLMISSRDGSILERIDSANLLSRIRQHYEFSFVTNNTVFSAAGSRYDGQGSSNGTGDTYIQSGQTVRFCVPLYLLSGFFNSKQLLPNTLCSGMRFDIQLESANVALNQGASATETEPLSYSITDCAIVCESYQLSDLVLRNLNQMASSSGLEYLYDTYFATQGRRSTTSINIESRKAVSRALSSVYIETLADSSNSFQRDSFASLPANILDIQARVGSLYLPNQSSLRASTPAILAPELFINALQAFEPIRTQQTNVSLAQFETSRGVFATSLERDTLGGSGIPLSNSRVLSINGTFSPVLDNTSYFVCLFLKHAALARCFNSNTIVEL